MVILSSRHLKFFSHKKSMAIKPPVMSKHDVARLPKELLCCIYQQLETRECQNMFSITCKSFHRIAMDKRTNAAWVVTRYGPRFAIYYALISFPTKCNSQFIHYLISSGAEIPRYLIQILVQVYGKPMDTVIKSSENRRRRSSFHTIDLDLFFLQSIQQLSFDGYAALITETFKRYGTIDVNSNDLALFLSCLDKNTPNQDVIKDQWFFPTPFHCHYSNYRLILKLAQTSPAQYHLIAPLFDFDPVARSALWEAILLVFFDEAFKSSDSMTREKQQQLGTIKNTVITNQHHVHLVGPLTDQQIFCQVFATFFTKYPVGYCHQKTMKKLLVLLKLYVKPNFNIDVALEYMVQANIGRSDTIKSVDTFLKEN